LRSTTNEIAYGKVASRKAGYDRVRAVVKEPPVAMTRVTGSLTRAEIAAIVNKHIGAIRYCYEKSLLENPGLTGKVLMEWEITGFGIVDIAKVKTASLRDSSVNSCLVREVRSWKFPKPRGGGKVTVSYPFIFNSI